MFRRVSLGLAALSLFLCVAAPLLYFLGRIDAPVYKTTLAAATVGWFVFATARALRSSR
jgi:hypothetical protein